MAFKVIEQLFGFTLTHGAVGKSHKQKRHPIRAALCQTSKTLSRTGLAAFGLLDLGFLEFHVLLCNRVIFAEGQFLCLGT